MRILFVSGSYPPMRCGVGDYTASLATALARLPATEVSVLSGAVSAVPAPEGPVQVLRTMRSWHWRSIAPFFEALQSFSPDVVHIQFPTQGYDTWSGLAAIACHVRLRRRLPVVVTLHEFFPKAAFRLERWIYALAVLAHRIVVVRPNYYPTIPALVRALVPERKLRFIGNASALPAVEMDEAGRRAVREELGCGDARLVAFFGFFFHHKGVDQLFRIADPVRDHLVLIGDLSTDDPYHVELRRLSATATWKGRATITGFVEPERAARLLAAADAAVFPYRSGGGIWNSSLHAATSQGTFVLTTATDRDGYDADANIYYARPNDIEEMRAALHRYAGARRPAALQDAWAAIAQTHRALYAALGAAEGSA